MSSVAATLGTSPFNHPLRNGFLKWQCRVRQIAMRELDGRPDDAITPSLTLAGETEPMGHIITVLNKAPAYSVTPEMKHMFAKTNDPAQVREAAITFLSAAYYQKHKEFSDLLCATFPPDSPGAAKIREAGSCTLRFDAYNQQFDLQCKVWRLAPHNPAHQATVAHNMLFNPAFAADSIVLGFEPDWNASTSEPEFR